MALKSFGSRSFAALTFVALFGSGGQVPVTPEVPASFGIAYPKAKAPAKHVQLSANTWQYQEIYGFIRIKYDTAAQHIAQKTSTLVSAYSPLDIETAQVQDLHGTISVSEKPADILPEAIVADVTEVSFGDILNTYQNQHISGSITLSDPIEANNVHSLANVSAERVQEVSGKVSVKAISQIAISEVATHQRQAISGSITTNDDDMLMALLALMDLDEVA